MKEEKLKLEIERLKQEKSDYSFELSYYQSLIFGALALVTAIFVPIMIFVSNPILRTITAGFFYFFFLLLILFGYVETKKRDFKRILLSQRINSLYNHLLK